MTPVLATLRGIHLQVRDERRYLNDLWSTLHYACPHLSEVVAEVEDRLGQRPICDEQAAPARVVTSLLDREWYDSPDNESDEFLQYLESRSLFDASSIYLLGAGTCRLADYLASQSSIASVTCADLSWLVLFFGKALIENRLDLLPPNSLRDRKFYEPSGTHPPELVVRSHPSSFKAPRCKTPAKIKYIVTDAFQLGEQITEELVCAPFLLDQFAGPAMLTLLIRICQQLQPNQRLLLFVSATPKRQRDQGRDPGLIVDVLRGCGLVVENLDIVKLPYTFSYHDFAHYRSIWNTLVVTARVVHPVAKDQITVCTSPGNPAASDLRKGNGGAARLASTTLSACGIAITERCRVPLNYRDLSSALHGEWPADIVDRTLGELAAKQMVTLAVA